MHLETLGSLDTPTLRLALRRFFAIRGTVRRIISDHGTNFIGVKNQLDECLNLETIIKDFSSEALTWDFIPPAASHFAGVWERRIGSVKRALNAAISQLGERTLSKDEFDTLIQPN